MEVCLEDPTKTEELPGYGPAMESFHPGVNTELRNGCQFDPSLSVPKRHKP
jgi:hypothetical protein